MWALGIGLGPRGCQHFPAGNWASLSQCVCNLHEYSEDAGPSLSKVGVEGHMPLVFKVTDEVDSWTDVVQSDLNTYSLRCDFYQHLHFSSASHPSGLVPTWICLMDSQEIQRELLIFALNNFIYIG